MRYTRDDSDRNEQERRMKAGFQHWYGMALVERPRRALGKLDSLTAFPLTLWL